MAGISNNEIKRVKALQQKKVRDAEGLFIVEGEKMVQEAADSPFDVIQVYHRNVIKESVPSWLTLKDGPMSGAAGEYDLVFSAEPIDGGREIEIQITAGGNAQYFRVRQGSMLASEATVKEVFEGADGKSYRVQGVCTSIANTYYGNWYLQDGTHPEEDLYIYGTKNADGQYDWESFDIEVGDSVMVEGPKTTENL